MVAEQFCRVLFSCWVFFLFARTCIFMRLLVGVNVHSCVRGHTHVCVRSANTHAQPRRHAQMPMTFRQRTGMCAHTELDSSALCVYAFVLARTYLRAFFEYLLMCIYIHVCGHAHVCVHRHAVMCSCMLRCANTQVRYACFMRV